MGRTPEGVEKDKLKKFLKAMGAYQFWPVPAGYGRQGVDCFACIKGQFWALEVKSSTGELTPRQRQTLTEVKAAKGGVAAGTADEIIGYLCNSIGIDVTSVGPAAGEPVTGIMDIDSDVAD